jgi:lipid-A-disaccharide synthase
VKILISAGEVSGDVVAARLTREIRRQCPHAVVFGIGGPRMHEAGAAIDFQTNHLGTVGLTEAFHTVAGFVRAYLAIRRRVHAERPDVAVLIANDLFNIVLARWLRAVGVPTLAYFPPQVWVWRALAKPIARSFDVILTSFSEEHTVYAHASRTTRVSFVGHYLREALRTVTPRDRLEARRRLGIPDNATVVSLLPGSRTHEIRSLAPTMLDSSRRLIERDPGILVLVSLAEPGFRTFIESEIDRIALRGRVRVVATDSHDVMRASDLLILASGTASLEATLLGVPMIIVYRVSMPTYAVVRCCIWLGLIESDTVGLPNLILNRRAVPELIQRKANADAIAGEAWAILSSPHRREEMHRSLAEAASTVRGDRCLESVAESVLMLARARAEMGVIATQAPSDAVPPPSVL